MDNIDELINFGLTRQEATVYVTLCSEGKLNGYEASKLTGISRSNAYNALAGLVEKGAAYIIEENSVYYTPVPIEEVCSNKIRFLEEMKNKLVKTIPHKRKESQGYITIKGEKHIMDKLNNMLLEARERVYLSLSSDRIEYFRDTLEKLILADIKVVIITNNNYKIDGAKVYNTDIDCEHVRLIVDSEYVLTGEIEDASSSTCLYSNNNNLVQVFKEALANKISLIKINKGAY